VILCQIPPPEYNRLSLLLRLVLASDQERYRACGDWNKLAIFASGPALEEHVKRWEFGAPI